ncbi:hypothetical protein DPEC_G00326550 [Dallia pectoralis]|uniref:Uncharacterized protein n=1 Tax=Dallia pectoralis TaxID=75939 RepID=A0ACC2F7V5_DALPE|nr:hypothetical protein DPEC_G00326550 [Dallia pectoralis]
MKQRQDDGENGKAVGVTGVSGRNGDMAGLCRSPSLQSNEILALYGPETGPYGSGEVCRVHEFDDADSEDGFDVMQRSLSLEEGYGMGKEWRSGLQRVYFSNQEYYQKLEDLKRTHLRNMADLEKMYIRGRSKVGTDDVVDKYLKRELRDKQDPRPSVTSTGSGPLPDELLESVHSEEGEEFNLHDEASSGVSDQSESGVSREEEDHHYELVLDPSEDDRPRSRSWKEKPLTNNLRSRSQVHIELQMRSYFPERGSVDRSLGKTGCPVTFPKCCGVQGPNNVRAGATVPKPFKMTLREEEKKRSKVRTRSDVELENSLLRRELNELRECGVKFRASPAPAHARLPLDDAIGRRPRRQLGNQGGNQVNPRSYMHVGGNERRAVSCSPPRPFSFLERERRKRERRIEEEMGNQAAGEEKRVFKARPVPRSVYCSNSTTCRPRRASQKMIRETLCHPCSTPHPGNERGDTKGGEDHSRGEEERVDTRQAPYHNNSYWRPEVKGRTHPSIKTGKAGPRKQLELQIEMESETRRRWSYIDPLLTRAKT